jgi:peroxiredoxin Q/BCP
MTTLNRRSLLRSLGTAGLWGVGASLLPAGLLTTPAPALALGGVLPENDKPAPDFTLQGVAPAKGASGSAVPVQRSLADFASQWLVLYFYPRDFTGGCTLEARGFQRDLAEFRRLNTAIVGISADSPDQHTSFCETEGLAFPLLSDPDGQVSRRYGSWMAPFSLRHTFLIDPDGMLRNHWVGVRPSGHSQEVLEAVIRFQEQSKIATV